ncbi:FtsK/SpoIIIE domain-containing protein [Ferrimicrobium acidiphilum]|uniref:FtsK/SpoIIIE domain-containing protein n=1 Tax=Ferrimicrobium acidiphilum TaxID=121039 RepID=UPI0023F48D49|nr:FtsK/SpoIIIE domain-containing protein [Ferrimicrobium acidiphilum]
MNQPIPERTDQNDLWTILGSDLWSYRLELMIIVLPILLWTKLYLLTGAKPATMVLAGMVSLLAIPWARKELRLYLRIAHWRRKLYRAIRSQDSRLYYRLPALQTVTISGGSTRISLRLRTGTSVGELEALTPYLEVNFRLLRAEVRLDPDDHSCCTLILRRSNPFAGGPIASAQQSENYSAWDPISIGIDEFGNELSVSLFEHNLLIGGEPGSGKSSLLQVLASTLICDPGVDLYLLDPKFVEFTTYQGAVTQVAHSTDEAIDTMKSLKMEARRRYALLTDNGLRKWTPDLGSLGVLIADELPIYLNDPDAKLAKEFTSLLRDITALGRAAGIVVVLAAQKPSVDSVPSGIRDLIDYRLAFRCATRDASDVILGAGQASRGFSASEIAGVDRGVGLLLAHDPNPRLMKSYFLDDAEIATRITHAREQQEGQKGGQP